MVTKVGIVDDSVIARSVLEEIINSDPEFEVVGKAGDPYKAREMIFKKKPDVLTLDVEMPRLDGISFLKSLMENYPLPVIMVSSLTQSNSKKGIRALELGAVDVVGKPAGDSRDSIKALSDDLLPKLHAAAEANVKPLKVEEKRAEKEKEEIDVSLPSTVDLIVIGSSTGGTKALREIFEYMHPDLPPILICQHMPPLFTTHFSKGLNEISQLSVREAKEKDRVSSGEVLLAPGDYHMVVSARGSSRGVPVELNQEEEINFQRPAVDPLFETAASYFNNKLLGIVLTGMGKDGRDGAKHISEAGGTVLYQDEASCSVFGMPKQVKENVPAAQEVRLADIPKLLDRLV